MKVLLFGRLGETIGREIEVDLPAAGCTVAALRQRLAQDQPGLGATEVRACVDRAIVAETARILPGQEVAFVPPLSGG